jgi:hypothetical protein
LATGKRELRRDLAQRNAAAVLGPIVKGLEVFALTGGAFSLVDVLVHVLDTTGPARVDLSTWTAASADISFAGALLREKRIERLRFLVDFSFPSRQPSYCAALRATFGEDAIRVSKNHAKFVLVRNASWNVVVRTSMNLNENRRFETVELSDDVGLASFLEGFVDEVFAHHAVGGTKRKPGQVMAEFSTFAGQELDAKSTDVSKLMSDATFGNDVRRSGLQFVKGGA